MISLQQPCGHRSQMVDRVVAVTDPRTGHTRQERIPPQFRVRPEAQLCRICLRLVDARDDAEAAEDRKRYQP